MSYIYSFTKKPIDMDQLMAEITASYPAVTSICYNDNICIVSNDPWSNSNILGVQGILDAHNVDPVGTYKRIVRNAILFGEDMLDEFAAENITLGITYAGKTKDVSDFLADATRYLQTGSLYEVINEIDRLINAGLPQDLSPFITTTRMTDFKNKILDYLT